LTVIIHGARLVSRREMREFDSERYGRARLMMATAGA
jgi:hypothetical protein